MLSQAGDDLLEPFLEARAAFVMEIPKRANSLNESAGNPASSRPPDRITMEFARDERIVDTGSTAPVLTRSTSARRRSEHERVGI